MSQLDSTQASVKGLRLAPRKVSVVANLVRGRSVADALVILEHTPRRAAKPIAKLLKSAEANAKTTKNLKTDTLVIDSIQVTAGPVLKRFRPAAMGRAWPYKKKSSHIVVKVSGEVKPKKQPTKKTSAKESK